MNIFITKEDTIFSTIVFTFLTCSRINQYNELLTSILIYIILFYFIFVCVY